jgi:hypothetical protein
MSVSYRHRKDQSGGLEIRISLTRLESESVGRDAQLMAEILDSALWALGMLRTGINSRDQGDPPPTPGDWTACIRGLDRLLPRVEGTRDGVVRAYTSAGGSLEHLAHAMNVDESMAQNHCIRIQNESPGVWESWAATSATERSRPR